MITFANITREPVDEWIGSGIAETVTADLKNVPGITVIGRERVFDALRNLDAAHESPHDDRFAIEIGRGLGARWIVAGAFQRFGPQIRITARFVEVDTGAVLRNVKIDGALDEIFALQDRIVFELTQDLKLTLEASTINQIRTPETRSVEAYELFSRGMMTLRLATRDAPDRAISTFERALAIDPDYAEAWAGLATAYQVKGVFLGLTEAARQGDQLRRTRAGARPEAGRGARRAGKRLVRAGAQRQAATALTSAIAHDPKHARAHAMLARVHWMGRGDIRAAFASSSAPSPSTRSSVTPTCSWRTCTPSRATTPAPRQPPVARWICRSSTSRAKKGSWSSAPTRVWATSSTGSGNYAEALKEYQTELLYPVGQRPRAQGAQPDRAAPEAGGRPSSRRQCLGG